MQKGFHLRHPLYPAYVFDGGLDEVHVVGANAPPPGGGTATDSFRLRCVFFDKSNTSVRTRLLEDLELSDRLRRKMDLADRERFEQDLFRTIERSFDLYIVRRRPPRVPPQKPMVFVPVKAVTPPIERPWIALALVDQNGKPVPGRPYRIVTADKQTIDGQLDDQGRARVDGLTAGTCEIDCPYVEPRSATTHVVEPGDHASRIALVHGFEDFNAVWSHPQNGDLRTSRDNPHQLVAGDEVFIPAIVPKTVYRPTDELHTFRVRQSPLTLRLKIMDAPDQPRCGATCTVDGRPLTSDADGFVEVPLDKLTDSSTLTVDGITVVLQVGYLNPLGEDPRSGWKARLYNMGYLVDPTADDSEAAFALQDFQAQYGLEVTGSLDDATTAKIKDVHGC